MDLVPVEYDPFSDPSVPAQTATPSQTWMQAAAERVGPGYSLAPYPPGADNPAGALRTAQQRVGSFVAPGLANYGSRPTSTVIVPYGTQGKILPSQRSPADIIPPLGDIANAGLMLLPGAGEAELAARGAEAFGPAANMAERLGQRFGAGVTPTRGAYSIGEEATNAGKAAIAPGAEGSAAGAAQAGPSAGGRASSGTYTRATPGAPGGMGMGSAGQSLPGEVAVYRSNNASFPEFRQVSGPQGAQAFYDAIGAAKASHPEGAAVTQYSPDEYAGMRTFLTPDAQAGFALHGDDIVSVFKNPQSQIHRATIPILDLATSQGGRRLDAFDTILPHLYSESGFRAISRTPFDPRFASEGWDYANMAPYNGGKPDVVFMVHDPANKAPYKPGDGAPMPDYGSAQALQQHIANGGAAEPVEHDPFQMGAGGDEEQQLGGEHVSHKVQRRNFQDAYKQGQQDYHAGVTQNPYPLGTKEHLVWWDARNSLKSYYESNRQQEGQNFAEPMRQFGGVGTSGGDLRTFLGDMKTKYDADLPIGLNRLSPEERQQYTQLTTQPKQVESLDSKRARLAAMSGGHRYADDPALMGDPTYRQLYNEVTQGTSGGRNIGGDPANADLGQSIADDLTWERWARAASNEYATPAGKAEELARAMEQGRQMRGQAQGFTTPAYRGATREEPQAPTLRRGQPYATWSTDNPELASQYAGGDRPLGANPQVFASPARGWEPMNPQVQPLQLNTSDYHVVDAGGRGINDVRAAALRDAHLRGKSGVVIKNVYDEPGEGGGTASGSVLKRPTTVYATFDPSTRRSRFARFDPSKVGSSDLLAGLAPFGVGVAASGADARR